MTIRPSSLPMLAQCPCFESDSTEFAEAGDKRHALFQSLLKGHTVMTGALPDDEFDSVTWSANFVRMSATQGPIIVEEKFTLYDDAFNKILEGTPDVVCGNEIFDLKWRERNYDAQMAAYALMLMQARGYKSVTVHLLFAERQRVQKLNFTEESARALVFGIIERSNGPAGPTPCDYCGWCANRLSCPALVDRANAVAAGREDWKLEQFHSSKIDEPAEMAKALRLARELSKWIEGVEYHAKKLAEKQMLPGFKWQDKRGRMYCTDAAAAYEILGLSREDFLKACDIRINTSKKYPDKKGVSDLYAAANSIKKAPAKRAVIAKLGDLVKRGDDSKSLVAVNAPDEGDDE